MNYLGDFFYIANILNFNWAIMKKIFTIVVFLLAGISYSSYAGSNEHNHHFSIFNGLSTNTHSRETDFTIGAEYAYSLPAISKQLAFGLLYEYVWGSHPENIFGIPVFYKFSDGFTVLLAPCFAMLDEEKEEKDNATQEIKKTFSSVTHFLLKAGVSYNFHIKSVSIAPTFNIDYTNSHFILVYGINFGIGF